ncbi:MAG: diaminobutyrate acetyltransferase [Rhizobiales bacterium]|nr:diaminobutyrate acetyltransferase [Hyphomicrobiales bacterium]
MGPKATSGQLVLREPRPEDGPAVTALIAACPPLDQNSAYCNLLQCSHFAETCIVAERDGKIVGWISAYQPPNAPDEIFIWQVAVDQSARGLGLGKKMLNGLLARPAFKDAQVLTTTVTADNEASMAMFTSFARSHKAVLERHAHFERDAHFAGAHDTEFLVSIGPLSRS